MLRQFFELSAAEADAPPGRTLCINIRLTHLVQAGRWHARFGGLMSRRRLMETPCALAAAED